jgi:Tfp pilus assembly protein PilZ
MGAYVLPNIGRMAIDRRAEWPAEHGFWMVLCALFTGIHWARIAFRKVKSSPKLMDNTLSSPNLPLNVVPFTRKAVARTAVVGVADPYRALLAECFRQFNIETVALNGDAAQRLAKEKFEACVLGLSDGADAVMEAARGSRSNSRCVIYGIGGNAQQAMRYSKYGINAMFTEPLDRSAALKLIRATRMLVLHEFRRYARIPIMTEVLIIGDGRRAVASSIEMSSGGMSVKSPEDFSVGTNVEVSFALMTMPRVMLKANVSWKKPKALGIKFDLNDPRRQTIKRWVESYLEN